LRYQQLHPRLIHFYGTYGTTTILEVYAYYKHDTTDATNTLAAHGEEPDVGTLIRFVENPNGFKSSGFCILPGLNPVTAEFDNDSRPAYFDHWVSCPYISSSILDKRRFPSSSLIIDYLWIGIKCR
jgi:hypothetical protein